MSLDDSRSDFESLTIEFKNEGILLYYEELISYCKLLTDKQRQLLLEKAREMIVGNEPKQSTNLLKSKKAGNP